MGSKVMMMSRIRNDWRVPRVGWKPSFSLIEAMLAVIILSVGMIVIYEAFFSSLNAFTYSSRRLNVLSWMNEKIWQTQDELVQTGELKTGKSIGSFVDKNRNFDWKMSISSIGQNRDSYLCKLVLTVFWKEPHKKVSLSQVAYVQN